MANAQITTTDPTIFVRPAIKAAPSYVPALMTKEEVGQRIKLDMNESPYGPSPRALEALRQLTVTHRYPDFTQAELRLALAEYTGKSADQIICGAGLDDVLNTFLHTVIEPGDEVIISEPTFGVYRSLVSLYGGKTVNVPLSADFQLDAGAVLAAVTDKTKTIVICNPNNPTGNTLSRAAIERIVDQAPCLVIIDEAYFEFAGKSLIDLIDDHPNVSIFRTMSKFAGLAGMRVGYGIFRKEMMPFINTAAPPFHNISNASQVMAIASLQDLDYLMGVVEVIVSDRNKLSQAMAALPGVKPFGSDTNFILARLPVDDASVVVENLAARGVFVRFFGKPELGIRDCLRVTVGLPEENQTFVHELQNVLAEMGHAT